MSRDIPESHENLLRQACALQAGAAIPEKVVELFWEHKTIADRIGWSMTIGDLVTICREAGYGAQTPKEQAPPSIPALWKSKKIKSGAAVEVLWRDAKVAARLITVKPGNQDCVVVLADDPQEKTVKPDQVSLPAAA